MFSPLSSQRTQSNQKTEPAPIEAVQPGLLGLKFRQMAQAQFKKFTKNEGLSRRVSAHLIIILLVALAISLRNISWTQPNIGALRPPQSAPVELVAPAVIDLERSLALPSQLSNFQKDLIIPAAVPHTIIPERARKEISTYVVQPGDTVFNIALKFGLAPETITWSNHELEDNPDLLQIDQELVILPVNGVYHQVGGEDTIESIAAAYQVEPAAIIAYSLNKLDVDNPEIKSGQWLVVPGGVKPFVPRNVVAYTGPVPEGAAAGSGTFGWPASGVIFQDFWSGHPGIDIADELGTPVVAADAGYVVSADWDNTGYGYTIVVDHGNGFQTLYAHLQAFYVEVGANVTKGQPLGEMGSSGNSTGPHVHFEIRQGTVQRNPHGFLP
ncbi:MAG: hypothetical protein DPW09_01295 [Anaerolineae bacterium]|nr:hypothetical protein [Anaerolineae bacterium]